MLQEIYMKFEAGLIEDYLTEKEKRDSGKPIIQ